VPCPPPAVLHARQRQPARPLPAASTASRARVALALALTLALVATPAAAQHLSERPDNGFLEPSQAVPLDRAALDCLTPVRVRGADEMRDWTCAVEFLRPLGAVDSLRWYVARYRRGAVYRDTIFEDSVEWDEVVLLSAADGGAAVRPVWHILTERTFAFLSDVRAERRTEGLLIELLICLNGTGGCGRHYLLDPGAGLSVVAMPFVDELRARLPDDHALHKGVTLDLATLRGTWPVALRGDANCCPSKVFDYEVRLDGASMVLFAASLRPRLPL